MIHLTIGLFKHEHQAGKAISKLKKSKLSSDISVIVKDDKTGKVRLHQVKESPGTEEKAASIEGAEVGAIAGIIGAISAVINPALASLEIIGALAAAMGVAGGAIGATFGGVLGSLNDAGLPPERAKFYKKSVHRGELLICISSKIEAQEQLKKILNENGASNIHFLEVKK